MDFDHVMVKGQRMCNKCVRSTCSDHGWELIVLNSFERLRFVPIILTVILMNILNAYFS